MSDSALRMICYVVAAVSLGSAGMYVIFGENTSLGIFLVLVAAILCRVLVLNLAEGRFRGVEGPE